MSRLTICCPDNDFSHEFFIYQDKSEMAEQIRKIIEDPEYSVLTLSTEESQFVYPLKFVRSYCFIRIDDYDDDTETSNDEPPGGKVISIDFTKKKK